jgi:hypothetical protein
MLLEIPVNAGGSLAILRAMPAVERFVCCIAHCACAKKERGR